LAALAKKPLEAATQESGPPDVGSALPGRDQEHGPLVGDLGKLAIEVEETGGGVDRLGRPQAHLTRL
jgi:hypothetical protein